MKTRKALMAAGLTVALTLGAAPMAAFAEDPTASVGTAGEFTGNKANTKVSVITSASQLKATIPLTMSIVAKSAGGDIVAPGKDKYAIENHSAFAVYVTGMTAENQTGWALVDEDPTNKVSDQTYGDLLLKINGKILGPDNKIGAADASGFKAPEAKKDAGSGNLVPGKLELDMTGMSSALKKTTADASGVHAVTVTYTIGTEPPTDPAPNPSPDQTPDPVS